MKSKSLLTLLKITVVLLPLCVAAHAFAEDGHGGHDAHEKGGTSKDSVAKVPDSAPEILKAIHEQEAKLVETVTMKQLSDVHRLAFSIRDLALSLQDKASEDKKAQVSGAVKSISKLANDLDSSGDANDQVATEANLKKLVGLLKVLDAQFGVKMN